MGISFYSGGAESDAADYTTLAIQIVVDNDYSFLIQPMSGRQIFWLWLAVLVFFMKIFGATNFIAIFATGLFGTLSIYLFFRLVMLIWDRKTSILITLIFALTPVHINISHNAFYDVILLSLLFFSLENYLKYFKENKKKYLTITGLVASLMVFIHPTGYIYIFLIWITFPFFKKQNVLRDWIYFSFFIGFLPLLQVILWKYYTGNIFPYQKLQQTYSYFQQFNLESFQIRHYIRYFLYMIISYSPLILLSLLFFLFDLKWKLEKIRILSVFSLWVIIAILMAQGSHSDFVSPVVFLFGILFMFLLKHDLLKQNKLIFILGLFGLSIFFLYLKAIPRVAFGPRQFVYPVAFFTPILWYYGEKIIKRKKLITVTVLSVYLALFVVAFIFHLPGYNTLSLPGFNATFSDYLRPALPYYERDKKYKTTLTWLKKNKMSPQDYIFSNIKNRWIIANLNMPQNHYLKSYEQYDLLKGFSKQSLHDIWLNIQKYEPRFIIWDFKLHNEEYEIVGTKGERKVSYSLEEFKEIINEKYKKECILEDEIIIFKKN
jgi:4-amino-4-deoxy-L-arabinose transferase-like glycosyltransferase